VVRVSRITDGVCHVRPALSLRNDSANADSRQVVNVREFIPRMHKMWMTYRVLYWQETPPAVGAAAGGDPGAIR